MEILVHNKVMCIELDQVKQKLRLRTVAQFLGLLTINSMPMCIHTHIHTHTHTYIYIYISHLFIWQQHCLFVFFFFSQHTPCNVPSLTYRLQEDKTIEVRIWAALYDLSFT